MIYEEILTPFVSEDDAPEGETPETPEEGGEKPEGEETEKTE